MRVACGVIFTICILLIVGIVFIAVDSGTGTVIAIDESPGVIMDLYKTSHLRTTTSGKTKIYYTDIDYMAEVMTDNAITQVEITEKEYWIYKTGDNIILVTYTTEGGISRNIYYTYAIRVLN